jgi:hypothetical protein
MPHKTKLPSEIELVYFGTRVKVEFQHPEKNEFRIGRVFLSKAGQELALVCGSTPREGFKEYVYNLWRGWGLVVTEILPS